MASLLQFGLDWLLAAAVAISTFLTVFLLTLPSRYVGEDEGIGSSTTKTKITSVQIVVLGDIGRSPRMEYHALSIAKHGGRVDIIGVLDSDVHPDVRKSPLITIVPIPEAPAFLQTSNKVLVYLYAPLKVLWQALGLYYVLGYKSQAAKWMLIQNPPFIPTFAIASFIAFFRNTRLIIDWHNFGHSIYALKLGSSHPLVLMYRWYESHAARYATAHFTVTNAMARVLKEDAGIVAHPLHDRPPDYFQPLSDAQRATFLQKFEPTRGMSRAGKGDRGTRINARLLVSSTSWTPDEDFSLLLDALVEYSSHSWKDNGLPEIIAVITGKGPQKGHYLSQIKSLVDDGKLERVSIHTAWLSMEDYASLLGSADLGVSLHTSSSGVDLPMKVVDMFGTGLPVVGWSKFEAWPELVQEGVNGRGFGRAAELAGLLVALFKNDCAELHTLRKGALKECDKRWDSEWDPIAGRILGLVD